MPVFLSIDDGVSSGSACRLTERNGRARLAGVVDDPRGGQFVLPSPGPPTRLAADRGTPGRAEAVVLAAPALLMGALLPDRIFLC